MQVQKRFASLRIVVIFYEVTAAILLLVSTCAGAPMVLGAYGTIPMGLGILAGGILASLSLFAVSEMIQVALSVEESVRKTAMLAEQGATGPTTPAVIVPVAG